MLDPEEHEGVPSNRQSPSPRGDDELLALFKARRDRLLAMVRRRVGPRLIAKIDPEDVLQDVFLRAQPGVDRPTRRPPSIASGGSTAWPGAGRSS